MLATMHKNANIMVVNVYYAVATLDTHIEYLYKKNTHSEPEIGRKRKRKPDAELFFIGPTTMAIT